MPLPVLRGCFRLLSEYFLVATPCRNGVFSVPRGGTPPEKECGLEQGWSWKSGLMETACQHNAQRPARLSRVCRWFALPAAVLLLSCSGWTDDQGFRLEFQLEVQNLKALRKSLLMGPGKDVTVCPDLRGEFRYGRIPYRLPGEEALSTQNFAHFVAAYDHGPLPTVLLDFNRDRTIGCDEELPLLPHPQQDGLAFRTVKLGPPNEQAPLQTRRYRLLLPTQLTGTRQDVFSVDIVDVPVARWNVEGRETFWILFDGNYDGVFDKSFGDGLLIDYTGEGRIDTAPQSGNFFSFHLPLALPWGVFDVADIDPKGRYITLNRLPDSAAAQAAPLTVGDVAEAVPCTDSAGKTINIGGASGRYQLLYFWISHCAGCEADMQEMAPLVQQLNPEVFRAIGVSLDEVQERFDGFASRHGAGWSHCFTATTLWDNAIARRFGAVAPSEYVLLDPHGRISLQGQGIEDLKKALQEISQLP